MKFKRPALSNKKKICTGKDLAEAWLKLNCRCKGMARGFAESPKQPEATKGQMGKIGSGR